jgi:hypothetical protein
MTQVFSTSAKCVSYYLDTKATQRLMTQFGSHLQGLTQEEKYQLVTAIGLMLWGSCEPEQSEAEAQFNDLSDLFEGMESEPDLIRGMAEYLTPDVTANVMSALVLLQNESPESLSFLLPAIAEYARDDNR